MDRHLVYSMGGMIPGTGVSILSKGSKLAHPSFNLPPEKTCLHQCTYCYAKKGNFAFEAVKKSMNARYEWYENNSLEDIAETISNAIWPFRFIRVWGSGDFKNARSVMIWEKVAKKNPDTRFWVSTKSYTDKSVLKELIHLANMANVTVRPSALEPYTPAPKIPGLHGGACIQHPSGAECTHERHCGRCIMCWTHKQIEISYHLR